MATAGDVQYNTAEWALLLVSIVLLCCVSIGANSAVLITVLCTRPMRTAGSAFLINLAISDLCMGILVLPMVLEGLVKSEWIHSESTCKAFGYCANVLLTTAALTAAVISLDRYFAIIHCLRYTSWSMWKYAMVIILLIWGQAVGLSLPPLLGWDGIGYQESRFSCFVIWESSIEYTVVILITNSILPLAVMLFCYSRIIIVAREHANKIKDANSKSIQASGDSHTGKTVNATGPVAYAFMAPIKRLSMLSFPSATKSFADPYLEYFNNNAAEDGRFEGNSGQGEESTFRKQVKAIARLISILLVFVLAWLPLMGVNVKLAVDYSNNVTSTHIAPAVTATTWLSLSSCAINPLLYAVFSRNFRIACKRVFKTRIYPHSHSGEERRQKNNVLTYAAILRRTRRSPSVISDPTYDRTQLDLQTFGSFLSLRDPSLRIKMNAEQNPNSLPAKSSTSTPVSSGQFLQVPQQALEPCHRLSPDSGGDSRNNGNQLPDTTPSSSIPNDISGADAEKVLCAGLEKCHVQGDGREGWTEDVKTLSDNKANIKIQLDLV